MEHRCALVWFRRDLRLTDNPALAAALQSAATVVPVYIHDPQADGDWTPGAASRAWLHHSLGALAADLAARGSPLVIRRGPARETLPALACEAGASAVYWNRLYEPTAIARDRSVKATLHAAGVAADSGNAALWIEPWNLTTATGGPYRVFTPFWRALSVRLPDGPVSPAPDRLRGSPSPLSGETVEQLDLRPRVAWDNGFWRHWQPGEAGALARLRRFVDGGLHGYLQRRDFPADTGVSRLSPHLHFGEIGPRQLLTAIRREQALGTVPEADAAHYLRELGWREFAHHLLFHFPETQVRPLNPIFNAFPWRSPQVYADDLCAWQRGQTGIPLIDAGMRELWTTGWMHNRVRMVVASFLTKNLLVPWQEGARWFWDTLVDADLANNTLGWQWVAGCGADAAPYFRIFNPILQAQQFDPDRRYVQYWLAHPEPRNTAIVDLAATRQRALDAYARMRGK